MAPVSREIIKRAPGGAPSSSTCMFVSQVFVSVCVSVRVSRGFCVLFFPRHQQHDDEIQSRCPLPSAAILRQCHSTAWIR